MKTILLSSFPPATGQKSISAPRNLAATHTYLLSILRVEVEEEFDHKLYSYFGVDCFSHLTRVTLGLDSAIIGETEIQGQVKLAYENTSDYHPLPEALHFLFQKSLGISKKLRSELQLGRGMPNLEHAALSRQGSTSSKIRRMPRFCLSGPRHQPEDPGLFKKQKFSKYLPVQSLRRPSGRLGGTLWSELFVMGSVEQLDRF